MTKEQIEICIKMIELRFKWLNILGLGFLSLIGIYNFLSEEFSVIIAKMLLVVLGFMIVYVVLSIEKKFAIIRKLNLKDVQ